MRVQEVPDVLLAAVKAVEIHRYDEDPATQALRRHMGVTSVPTTYPRGSIGGRCDLVVPVDGGAAVWIERKNAWTYKSATTTAHGRNGWYHKHLFSENERDHSALFDLRVKLPSLLGLPGVSAVGLQLMVFDSIHEPFDESHISLLEEKSGIARDSAWTRSHLPHWRNPLNPRGEAYIRAYYWHRLAA